MLLKAIGRHGDPSSLTVLSEHPFQNLTVATGRARILGIARVHSRAAVEALMKGMSLAGGQRKFARKASEGRFKDAFRLALAVLTGIDLGESRDAWMAWWRDNRRGFQMGQSWPNLAPDLRVRWEEYWGEAYGTGDYR